MRLYFLSIVLFFSIFAYSFGQYQQSELKPYSSITTHHHKVVDIGGFRSTTSSQMIPMLILPPLNVSIKQSHNLVDKKHIGRTRPLQFAKQRTVFIDPFHYGEIINVGGGHYLWQCSIVSRGAKSIGLHFSYYHLPQGARLFVRNKQQVNGAYTDVNNNKYNTLQLSPVVGDSVVVEYDFPVGVKPLRENIPIRIDRLYHDYIGVYSLMKGLRSGQSEPLFNYQGTALKDLICAPEILGYPEVYNQSRGVVLLIVNGQEFCSGSLINNTNNDGSPYILTASHCINNNFALSRDKLDTVKTNCHNTIVFFNFTSPVGNHTLWPTESQTLAGCDLAAYNDNVDMALLKITGLVDDGLGHKIIPVAYNPYFNGWNLTTKPKGPYYCIHHPLATTKRFSEVADSQITLDDYSVSLGLFSGSKDFYKDHWNIDRWAIGTTAPGSSGAPLFDHNGLIIGALTGGASTCDDPTADSFYAICRAWNPRPKMSQDSFYWLSHSLDPNNTGATSCPPYDPIGEIGTVRLSKISGNPTVQGISIADIPIGVNEVGSVYHLDKDDKIDGAYFCLVGSELLNTNFPILIMQLSKVNSDGSISSDPLWTTAISHPVYKFFNHTSNQFGTLPRTLSADSCEIFVPINQEKRPIVTESGNYFLSIKQMDGLLPTLKLLSINVKAQLWATNNQSNNSFSYSGDRLQPLSDGSQSLWLDLLINRPKLGDDYIEQKDLHVGKLNTYFRGGIVYISAYSRDILPPKTRGQLFIYDYSGSIVYHTSFGRGDSAIRIDNKLVKGFYIIRVQWINREEVLKVYFH